MEPIKVLVSGASFCGNAGGAALYFSLIDEFYKKCDNTKFTFLLKYPKDEISICKKNGFSYAEWTTVNQLLIGAAFFIIAGLLKLLHLPWRWLVLGRLKCYLEHDVMVDLSGISFSDDLPLSSVLINSLWFLPAFITGIPIVKVSQSIGPFSKPIVRAFAQKVLRRIDIVIARGNESYDLVKSLLPEKYFYNLPDIAFCLNSSSRNDLENLVHKVGLPDNQRYIAASASYVVEGKMGRKNYAEAFAHLLKKLHALSGLPIVFIPHCRNHTPAIGIDSKHDDWSINQNIKLLIENEVPSYILNDETDPRLLKALIGGAEVAVGSRYHFMVAAMSSCVPAMTIGWSHKYLEMMELINQGRFVIKYQDLNTDQLDEKAEELWHRKAEIKREIGQLLPDVKEQSAENISLALSLIQY